MLIIVSAGRIARTVSDFTFGTVIVLVHIALAERDRQLKLRRPARRHLVE
jgi:hypothetical protein